MLQISVRMMEPVDVVVLAQFVVEIPAKGMENLQKPMKMMQHAPSNIHNEWNSIRHVSIENISHIFILISSKTLFRK